MNATIEHINSNVKTPFKLFENCFLSKGYLRSTIVDVQRGNYYLIPNILNDILKKHDGKTIEFLIDLYGKKHKSDILNYFEFLFLNELIFFTLQPNLFPKISTNKWKTPSLIYQAIIDIDNSHKNINSKVFESLNHLNCKYLDLRVFGDIKIDNVVKVLKKSNETTIIGINIYMKFISYNEVENIRKHLNSFLRVNTIYFYSAPKDEQISFQKEGIFQNVFLIKEEIKSCLNCGVVSKNYFSISIEHYTKSVNCNSCLHGKIGIDSKGNIKNCPSLKNSFGNIKNTKLEEAIGKKGFKKYWNIKKDDILVCKDCEFRHMCTDCRAYVEEPNESNSKPLKCGYDPYTGIWQEWSKNPLKQRAIDYYNMREIVSK